MAATRLSIAIVLLVCVAQLASAYPSFYPKSGNRKCTDHPNHKYGEHKDPTPDSAITVSLTDAKGAAVKTLCPGATYKVTVGFPEARLALVTASGGKFDKSDAACPNRVIMDKNKGYATAKAQSSALTLGCDQTGSVAIRVTSAKGVTGAFRQAIATFPVNAACGCKKG